MKAEIIFLVVFVVLTIGMFADIAYWRIGYILHMRRFFARMGRQIPFKICWMMSGSARAVTGDYLDIHPADFVEMDIANTL